MENQQQPQYTNQTPPVIKKGMSTGAAIVLGISGIIIAVIIAAAIIFASGAKTVRDVDFEKFDGFEININENGEPTSVNVNEPETPETSENSSVTLWSPNGGERLVKGDTYTIEWKIDTAFHEAAFPKVSIELVAGNNKQSVTPEQFILADNTGSYDWAIPTEQLSFHSQSYPGGPAVLTNTDGNTPFYFLINAMPHLAGRSEGSFDYSDTPFYID